METELAGGRFMCRIVGVVSTVKLGGGCWIGRAWGFLDLEKPMAAASPLNFIAEGLREGSGCGVGAKE